MVSYAAGGIPASERNTKQERDDPVFCRDCAGKYSDVAVLYGKLSPYATGVVAVSQTPESLTLTIFTPTYNRAHLLPRLFESIKSQVHQGDPVEWLVIDDGSTDDTVGVLEGFACERKDMVRLVHVENGGKHRAINLAAKIARGNWIMIVDSDDRLIAGAVRQVLDTIRLIDSDTQVGVLRALSVFPELASEHSFKIGKNPCRYASWITEQRPFDASEVVRRAALLLNPFPEFSGERFMAEGWLWHRLDRTHLTFFINTNWVECFYQHDGLSANSSQARASSPLGAISVYAAMLDTKLPFRWRFRSSINWWRYYFHAAHQHREIESEFSVSLTYAPFGWLMYLRDRLSDR